MLSILIVKLLLSASLCLAQFAPPVPLAGQSLLIFDYDPASPAGPPNWGDLRPDFSTCATGTSQSPIDVPANTEKVSLDQGPITYLFSSSLQFVQEPFNFDLPCATAGSCGSIFANGQTYNFIGMHFHSPSEHAVEGILFPLESHMVFSTADGALAVIGTFFQASKRRSFAQYGSEYPLTKFAGADTSSANPTFESILTQIEAGQTILNVDLNGMLTDGAGYCMYDGSLTTPPCSEGVAWMLSRIILEVSSAQLARYINIAGSSVFGNNRPIQPLNGRVVTCSPSRFELFPTKAVGF